MLEFQHRASRGLIEADQLKRAETVASTILFEPLVGFMHKMQKTDDTYSFFIPFVISETWHSIKLDTGNELVVYLTEKGPRHIPAELSFTIETPGEYGEMYKFKPFGAIMLSVDTEQDGKWKKLSADELKSKLPLFRDIVKSLQTA